MSGWGDLLKGKFKEVIDKSTGEKIMVDVNSREYDLDASGNIVGGVPNADGAEEPKRSAPTGFVFGGGSSTPAAGSVPTFSFGVPSGGGGGGGGGGFSFGVPAASAAPVFGAAPGASVFGGFGVATAPERRKRKALNQLGRMTGDVFVAGNGDCSQMGLGEDEGQMECAIPQKLPALSKQSVIMIACGGMHTIALTQGGALWSWGCNDDCALGRDGEEAWPALVGGVLSGQSIIAVTAGDCHSVALHSDGRVFSWGTYKDSNGYIGYAPQGSAAGKREKADSPTLVPGLEGVHVTCIASGSNHTLAIARGSPQLYAWGCGEQGQLGRTVTKETRVANLVPARPALTVGAGGGANGKPAEAAAGGGGEGGSGGGGVRTARALNANFVTFLEGLSKTDAAGDWSDVMDEYLSHQRSLPPQPAPGGSAAGGHVGGGGSGGVGLAGVFGGSYHSFALTTDGAVYAFGLNNMGQLGLGAADKGPVLEPRRVHGASAACLVAPPCCAVACLRCAVLRCADGCRRGRALCSLLSPPSPLTLRPAPARNNRTGADLARP